MDDKDTDKTALAMHPGLFKCTSVPFELKNSPLMFQRAMNVVFASEKRQKMLVCNNIIITLLKTAKDILKLLDEVLHLLMRAGLTIKIKDCHIYSTITDYRGHVRAAEKLKAARKATESVEAKQYPTNISKVKLFLELCNVCKRLLYSFTHLTTSFNKFI